MTKLNKNLANVNIIDANTFEDLGIEDYIITINEVKEGNIILAQIEGNFVVVQVTNIIGLAIDNIESFNKCKGEMVSSLPEIKNYINKKQEDAHKDAQIQALKALKLEKDKDAELEALKKELL